MFNTDSVHGVALHGERETRVEIKNEKVQVKKL